MTAAWARGDTETSMAKVSESRRTIRPTHLRGERAVCFPLSHFATVIVPISRILQAAVRSVTHLGWGIDMVAGNAEVLTESQTARLPGEVWRPESDHSGTGLRVPKEGTLNALMAKHQEFPRSSSRTTDSNLCRPLGLFQVVSYRRATDPPRCQYAAFSLLKPDAGGMRSFDTTRRIFREVAGMLRSAVARVARDQGWSDDRINVFVHGKTPDGLHPANGRATAF